MRPARAIVPLILALVAVLGARPACAQTLEMTWFTIDGGGGILLSGDLELAGTIGQPDAGVMTSGDLVLEGGFWAGVVPTCSADLDGDGFLSGDDFTLFVTWFEAGDPRADFDRDGFVSGDDFGAFVTAFEIGC